VNSSLEVNNRILKFNITICVTVLQLAGVSLAGVLTCLKETSISVNNSLFFLGINALERENQYLK
jgi:hypothetical protein